MMNASKIAGMAARLIPDRKTAVVTLNPDTGTPVTVTVQNAWIMQDDGGMHGYGNVNVQNTKTLIKFLDKDFNPLGEGREVRSRDTILFDGQLYRATDIGGNLETMRTTWVIDVQKEIE